MTLEFSLWRQRGISLWLFVTLLTENGPLPLAPAADAFRLDRGISRENGPAPLPAEAESEALAERKWAVIVGANAYLDERIPTLRFCAADAVLVGRTLVDRGGYAAEDVVVLADNQDRPHLLPLAENIEKQIRLVLQQARAGDTVLVYFSGHGFLNERGEGFLAPLNCRRDRLEETSLSTGKLREWMAGCAAKRKLLVLDCCHAGADKSGAAAPGASGEELGAVFRESQGMITLASCLAQEVSLEWDQVGQGLFTHFFARALAGEADENRDGIVDSDEVYTFVFERVAGTSRRELNRTQRPVRFVPPSTIGKFPLARVHRQEAPARVEPAQAGAELRLFLLEPRTARSQYEHAGAGTAIDSVVDGGARWSPKQALFSVKPDVAGAYEKAIVAGLWTGYWQVPADGSYTFQFESVGHGWNQGGCCLRVQVGTEQVLDEVFGVYGLGRRTPCIKTADLKQGWQRVTVWLATTGAYDDMTPKIRFRVPGTDGFATLSPAVLKRP